MKKTYGPPKTFATKDAAEAAPYECKTHGPQKARVTGRTNNGWHRRCPVCYAALKASRKALDVAYMKKWNAENSEYVRSFRKSNRASLKAEIIAAYGGSCKCCGENFHGFLEVDHINNDGGGRKRNKDTVAFYATLKRSGFPQDRFQLLCRNCNFRKHVNGGVCDCPFGAKSAALVAV